MAKRYWIYQERENDPDEEVGGFFELERDAAVAVRVLEEETGAEYYYQ